MADNLNSVEKLRERLEAVDCPHVVGIDQDWILCQLVSPSEKRVKIIEWLLCMIEPTMLATINMSVRFDNESRRKDLLTLLSSLGFCAPDRMDLITGTASKRDQLQLFSLLLDIVEVCHGEGYFGVVDTSLLAFRHLSNVDSDWEKREQFVHQIATQPAIMKNLLSHKVDLLPGEVSAHIMKRNQQRNTEDLSKNRTSDLVGEYTVTVEKLTQELEEKTREMEMIKDKYIYNPFTSEEITQMCHRLDAMVTSMNVNLERFHSCYDNELVSWCRLPDSPPTHLGTVLGRLYTKMDAFALMISTFHSVRTTTQRLADIDTVTPDHSAFKVASDSFFLTLKDFLSHVTVSAEHRSVDDSLSV